MKHNIDIEESIKRVALKTKVATINVIQMIIEDMIMAIENKNSGNSGCKELRGLLLILKELKKP